MPSERFYLAASYTQGMEVEILGQEQHHLSHVMRVAIGETIELVDGQGALAEALVLRHEKRISLLKIVNVAHFPPPQCLLELVIPMLRASKLELIVEKATELGADAFHFYPADLAEKTDISQNAQERLRLLSISALKQSGRLYLPKFSFASHLEHLLQLPMQVQKLFGDLDPTAPSLFSGLLSLPLPEQILFITGPEKGFSTKERQRLSAQAHCVRLNANILRAETAPITATALIKGVLV